MKMRSMSLALVAFSAAVSAKPVEAPYHVVRAALAPYADEETVAPDYLSAPRWTTQTRVLIKRWQAAQKSGANGTDVTPLGGGDWLCQCQDWDAKQFRIKNITLTNQTRDRLIADTRYMITAHDRRRLRFVMIREGGTWRIDDLIFDGQRATLKAQLRSETNAATRR